MSYVTLNSYVIARIDIQQLPFGDRVKQAISGVIVYGRSPRIRLSRTKFWAGHAAVAMTGVAAERQSELGLATRDIIGQAERILMHWMDLTSLQRSGY